MILHRQATRLIPASPCSGLDDAAAAPTDAAATVHAEVLFATTADVAATIFTAAAAATDDVDAKWSDADFPSGHLRVPPAARGRIQALPHRAAGRGGGGGGGGHPGSSPGPTASPEATLHQGH